MKLLLIHYIEIIFILCDVTLSRAYEYHSFHYPPYMQHYYQHYQQFPYQQQQHQQQHSNKNLPQIVVEWNQLEYDFPSQQERDRSIKAGNYIPGFGLPVDVQPYYEANGTLRIFVTSPRFFAEIPFTLSEVKLTSGEKKLQAFPSYKWHNTGHIYDCDKITSVFRVAITECRQMWILDSGLVAEKFTCPPQLLLFDLTNDKLIHRFQFDRSLYVPEASYLVTPLAIVNDPPPQGKCNQQMVYMADTDHHGLVMYDTAVRKAWRAENKNMYPSPEHGSYTVSGLTFTLMDGIIGLAADKDNLYFHAMAGVNELKIPLHILNNASIFEDHVESAEDAFQIINKRNSPCIPSAIDSKGFLYCVTLSPIELIAWHPKTQQKQSLSINKQHLEFVCGLKIIKNHENVEEIWMLSNRFQRLATGTLNANEINFRILKKSLDG